MFFSFAFAKVSNLEKPGKSDYLLKIHAPSMKYYQEFVLNVLGIAKHVRSGLIDGYGTCIGGGVGLLLTYVQLEGFKV